MIRPIPSTIGELFSQLNTFEIPRYQRSYAWHSEEIEDLIEDLTESPSSLYLGTMIFDASGKAKTGSMAVVDGQQRFTTLLLMLIACRQAALQLGEGQIAAQTQSRIAFVNPATGVMKGTRLKVSSAIEELFTFMASDKWDGSFPTKLERKQIKRQVSALKPAYDRIEKALQLDTKEKLSNVLNAIYEISIIRIDVDAEEEAFRIFERTNARGVDLEVEDLLKNFLYQRAVPELGDKWSSITANADGTMLRMLKYFYVSRRGPVLKSELYKHLKEYAKELGSSEVLVEELLSFSRFYSNARHEQDPKTLSTYLEEIGWTAVSQHVDRTQRIYLSLQALRFFKVTQPLPLLYAAFLCAERLGALDSTPVAKQFIRLLESLENFHFLNSAIGERPSNEVERLYANYCNAFQKTSSFETTMNELMSEMKDKLISESAFAEKFEQLSYSDLGMLNYVFDRTCNFNRHPSQRLAIFDPDPKLRKRNHNIEHFSPKKPKTGEPLPIEILDNIGNLLAISLPLNSNLQNDSPEDKVKRLKTDLAPKIQNATYVNEFIDKYGSKAKVWDKDAVTARAKEMASEAHAKIWKFPKSAY